MEDMTDEEARAEAIKRWGPGGTIRVRQDPVGKGRQRPGRLALYRCVVGNGERGSCPIQGQGNTWREAFDDARPVASLPRAKGSRKC